MTDLPYGTDPSPHEDLPSDVALAMFLGTVDVSDAVRHLRAGMSYYEGRYLRSLERTIADLLSHDKLPPDEHSSGDREEHTK